MENKEIREIIIALQERNNKLEANFNTLADAGDNISAKGAKKQIQLVRSLIRKIQNSEGIMLAGEDKKEEKKPTELNLKKQKEILIDLSFSLLKELKEGELKNHSKLRKKFINQAENKIKEIEEMGEK